MINHSTKYIKKRPAIRSLKIIEEKIPEEEEEVSGMTTVSNGDVMDKYISVEEWKEILDFTSEKVVENTLEATMQICIEPVEI